MDHQDQVAKLLSLGGELAEAKAQALRSFWGFPNNYTMSKRLSELLVRALKPLNPDPVEYVSSLIWMCPRASPLFLAA